MIGNTPLVARTRLDTGPCRLYPKLESQNSRRLDQGSHRAVDDRGGGARWTLNRRHLVEATAGKTGLGLALSRRRRAITLILVIPDKMSQEKIFTCGASAPR